MIKPNPLVMIPGPTPIARSVMEQLGRETISYNDLRFSVEFKGLIEDMKSLWRCEDGMVFIAGGSGTMAMEMGISNTASRGERVLVCSNGFFGDRYVNICERKGFDLDVIRAEWGKTVTTEEIEAHLAKRPSSVVVVTHVETSTGVEFPLREAASMIRAGHPDTLLVVDGVASVGGAEFYMDWGIDIMLTCSQKCLGAPPGLGAVWASPRAIQKRESMPTIAESYVDFVQWIPVMKDTMKYWGTPAVNMVWALREGVRLIKEEGIPERDRRHRLYAEAVRRAMGALGFKHKAPIELASPTVTVFLYPDEGIDDAAFRAAVYDEGAQIAPCQGQFLGKGFRIGHMGNITPSTIVSLIAAVERGCVRQGIKIELGSALAEAQRVLTGV
ncbi:serine--pyruvate aminotransferase [Synergistales bacterium]|nr:serine--pyruvate aminotransferase [Synergistales bacterium]GHV53897.1 serine--pyruvate aminotransferase [Synergistales bacterium]